MASEEHSYYQNITIESADWAIRDWFNNAVDAHVETPTHELKKVPVIFASGERWAMASEPQRAIRDKNGLLILPLISIRRTNIDRNRNMSSFGASHLRVADGSGNKPNKLVISKMVDKKTSTVQNAINSRSVPNRAKKGKVVYELTTIPFPDISVVSFEVVIQTQYTTQMNAIVEKIFNTFDFNNSFVMQVRDSKFDDNLDSQDPLKLIEGYYFMGFADVDFRDSGNFEEFTDIERIVKYTLSIDVPLYMQLDPEGTKPALQKEYTAFDIGFSDESVTFVDDPELLDLVFTFKK